MAPEAAAHPREAGWIRKKYLFATAPASESKDGRPSVSETFVNRLAKDGFSKIDYRSLFEVFRESVQRYSASPCLGRRDENGAWQFETYTVRRLDGNTHALYLVTQHTRFRNSVFL